MEEKKIVLDDDQKLLLLKALKDIRNTSGTLFEWVQKGTLSEDMSKTLPSLIETYFSEAASILNYESHLLEEKKQRYADIRKANQTIHSLREKLGSSKTVDGLSEQLNHLANEVRDWWNNEGFNHVSREKFYPNGNYRAELSFMLDSRYFLTTSKKPASEERDSQAHIQHLRDLGFEFADFETGRSEKLNLIDNQTNRTLLTNMLRKRFPSISINSWNNKSSYSNPDIFVIWHVDISINDLTDI